MVKFLLLAADAVSSAPQVEEKPGAYEWFAFSIIVSLGLFICWHLFFDNDVPPSCSDGCEDDRRDTNPDHEVWV